MNNKYISRALGLLFALIALGYCYHIFFFAAGSWGYVVGDWFINFTAGFVRRGLSGYLVTGLSELLGIQLNYALILLQVLLTAGYLLLFYSLLAGKKLTRWFLFMLLSPATLFFGIFDPNAAGRKEVILFLLFALYLTGLKKGWFKHNLAVLCLSLALLAATLFHELVFFFTPYFLLAGYLSSTTRHGTFRLSNALSIIAGSCLVMVPIGLYGSSIDGAAICSSLREKGLPESICFGILSWPDDYGIKNVFSFANEANYFFVYGTTFLLSLFPFLLFVKHLQHPAVSFKRFLAVFGFLLLFSSPLFILAVDWGRWLNIHFTLLLLTSTLLLKDAPVKTGLKSAEKIFLPEKGTAPASMPARFNRLAFMLGVVAYVSLWSMPHFGYSNVFSFTRNFYSIKHLAVDIIQALF